MSQAEAGNSIQNLELLEGAPDTKVNFAQELSCGNALIIQVPAAFTMAATESKVSKQLGTQFPFAPSFGYKRSTRSAIVTVDGKIRSVHIEPDNIGIKESCVEAVLGKYAGHKHQ